MQVRESVSGFKERRGPNENSYSYPIPPVNDIIFDLPYFTRNYFTTGVILTHPALNRESVNCIALAELIFEAFLMLIPFERQDISFSVDKHRSRRQPLIKEQDKFIAIYDQTYGSLRLSGRFAESTNIKTVLEKARQLAKEQKTLDLNAETRQALNSLAASTKKAVFTPIHFGTDTSVMANAADSLIRIIIPGSKGLNLESNNEEFQVERVFLTPAGLRYAGPSSNDPTAKVMPLTDSIAEIPGESQLGYYNIETGEITKSGTAVHIQTEAVVEEPTTAIKKTSFQVKKVDTDKLKIVLIRYFDNRQLIQLAQHFGIDKSTLASLDNKTALVRILIAYCEQTDQSTQLLKAARILYERLHGKT